jgi:hypothetical protein
MAREDKNSGRARNYSAVFAKTRVVLASYFLAVLGIILLVVWAVAYHPSNPMSMLLFLSGFVALTFAILLYFITPSHFVRDDVCNAMVRAYTMTLDQIMDSFLIESKGIYIPDAEAGVPRLFIPLSDKSVEAVTVMPDGGILENNGFVKWLSIPPPGHGLFLYALGIGATFTDEGLESEVRDVLVNGLELSANVAIKREGDLVAVTLRDPVNKGLCSSIRAEGAGVCTRTGCPICSFVACMVAAGTGKNTRIKDIEVDSKSIKAEYELL